MISMNNVYNTVLPNNPVIGDMFYDTKTSEFKVFDGKNWQVVANMVPINQRILNLKKLINRNLSSLL